MDNNNPIIKWTARVVLALLIAGVVYVIIKYRKKNFHYMGIKAITKPKATFTNLLLKNFKPEKQEKKKKAPKKNKTEEKCRKIIQKIYDCKFPTVRPDFLKSPMTGKNLELDCYNEDLRIALEYNGKQHYTYTPHFHKSKKDFFSQVHRDDWKRSRCRELGIRLIEIPYWVIDVDLEDYIRRELQKKGCL